MPRTATVVAHLAGSREEARKCLRALEALDPSPEHEAIVVDDGTAGLEDLFDGASDDIRIVRNEYRAGLVASASRAAGQASGDVLVLLRGGAELIPSALAPLLAALEDPALAGAASALPLRPDSHPACSYALALRREDSACLDRVIGAVPDVELAAICVELAASGRRVATVAGSVAIPPGSRVPFSRARLGEDPELTVVIPTLDATSERVRTCIAAVQARTEAPHQIVVVDNGAPPRGFTAPVNAGLRAVDTPYAVVMNDDVEPLSGWWPPLREALEAGAQVAFPLTDKSWTRTDFAAWCFAVTQTALAEMSHAPGEFFDPQLRVWYQDTDLLTRLRAADCTPQLVRESRIHHGLSLTVESQDPDLRAWIEDTVEHDRAAFQRKHPSVPVSSD